MSWLQFGHDVSVVENAYQIGAWAGAGLLQFGHDVSVVENDDVPGAARLRLGASIWPRRQRRGENSGVSNSSRRVMRFNLATTSASWRTPDPYTETVIVSGLQFGHDVSVVENGPSRVLCDDGTGFNLATTSASWRTRLMGGLFSGLIRPLQFGHDVSVVENPAPNADDRARSMLQFGHDVSVVENNRQAVETPAGVRLQFGHDVSVVENLVPLWYTRSATTLQFGHDVSVVENRCDSPKSRTRGPGFNLATTSASWRTRPARVVVAEGRQGFNLATTSASWRTAGSLAVISATASLQFGHDVSVVENGPVGVRPNPRAVSLQFGHDVSVVENVWNWALARRRAHYAASIWPRRQRRGEQPLSDVARGGLVRMGFNLATTSASWRTGLRQDRPALRRLRFNLATTSASWRTNANAVEFKRYRLLQFGHDVSVVENGQGPPALGERGPASIWPRRQRRGEPRCWRAGTPACTRFNLATTSASWRTPRPPPPATRPGKLQFGHDVSVVENTA